MTSPFETALRAALREHAALMPGDTADRLARVDYWPAAPQRVRVRPIAGVAGVAIACCAVIAVLLFSSSSGPLGVSMANADWSATPTKPTPAALTKALAACNWLADHRSATKLIGRRVLTDARGKFVAVIYVSGARESDCISDGRDTSTSEGSDDTILAVRPPGPDQLGLASGGAGSAPGFPGGHSDSGVFQYTRGLAGRNVIAVSFRLADRMTVHATVQNGWYFAWWPNADFPPTSVQLTMRSGSTITSRFNCQTNVHGCAFAGFESRRR